MLTSLIIWAALLLALLIFGVGRQGRSGALTLAYFLGLSLIHVPGALLLLDPESGFVDWDETQVGFELTLLGMAAFVGGAVLGRSIERRRSAAEGAPLRWRALVFERLGWRALVLGVVAYFLVLPLSSWVPSLTSIVAGSATLLIIGLWLVLYGAAAAADRRSLLAALALLPLLPLATLVTGGFLGFGVNWVLCIVTFHFVITRRRTWFYLSAPAVAFLGLSLFVTYMGERTEYRKLLVYERPGILDRLDRLSAIITDFRLLDLSSPTQISGLARLNQNQFVGAAVAYHDSGGADFAYGGTIPPWAFIPRAIWPNKPDVGGGGDDVSKFTGIQLADGSAFGAGQVMEFYINFGIPGVIIGFLGLGYLLMRLDHGIMRSLGANDMHGFLLRAMPGLMLMSPGGSLREMLVACVAAYITARLVIWLRFFDVPLPARSRRQMA